jgi:hypothetical protein
MLSFRTNPHLDSSLKDQNVCARMHISNYEYDLTMVPHNFSFVMVLKKPLDLIFYSMS